MNDSQSVAQRVRDVDLVEQMLARVATPEEAAAARRVLGVEREADSLALAHSPEPPPPPPVGINIDHLDHARSTIARYTAWVDSYPDDDPTPLRERQRVLHLAHLDLERLENR